MQGAGPRAHRVEVRLEGAGDRANGDDWCREVPNNPPIT